MGSDVLKETEGVVLIDDIDTHLHPNMQRGIIERLKTTFPKIQFIATTHSPFIVQSLKADEVFNLDGHPIDEHPDTMSLEKIALFMGVESVESKAFHQKEKIAVRFIRGIVAEEEDEETDLAQLIKHTDDPVFKAKLELARLAKLHNK
ncbi:MAG: AAA family ATPase [Bacteroidota bacterium]